MEISLSLSQQSMFAPENARHQKRAPQSNVLPNTDVGDDLASAKQSNQLSEQSVQHYKRGDCRVLSSVTPNWLATELTVPRLRDTSLGLRSSALSSRKASI